MAELENLKEVLKKTESERSAEDLQIIYENLRNLEATSRLQEEDLRCLAKTATYEHHESNFCLQRARGRRAPRWAMVLTGSAFVDGALCTTGTSVGRVVPGSLKRNKECFVFESVDLILLDHVSREGEGESRVSLHVSRDASARRSRRHGDNRDALHRDTVSDDLWKPDITQNALHCGQSDPSDSGTSSLSDLFQMEECETSESKTSSPSLPPPLFKKEGGGGAGRPGEEGVEEEEVEDDEDDDEEDEEEEAVKSRDFVHLQIRPILSKPPEQRSPTEIEDLCASLGRVTALSSLTTAVLRDISSHLVAQTIARRGTVIQHDGEQVESWMMVLCGVVAVELRCSPNRYLEPGDATGTCDDTGSHRTFASGVMKTSSDTVELVSVTRDAVREARLRVEARTSRVEEGGRVVMETEMRGGSHLIVKALPERLLASLLCDAFSGDATFVEDFLLTKRVFLPDPLTLASNLTHSLTKMELRLRAATVLVLWVSEFYEEFEENPRLSESLLSFHSSLHDAGMLGHVRLLEVAVAAKSQLRAVTMRLGGDAGRHAETRGGETERHAEETREGGVEGRRGETRGGGAERTSLPFSVHLGHGGELVVMETDGDVGGLRRGDQVVELGGVPLEEDLTPSMFAERVGRRGDITLTVRLNMAAYFQLQRNPSPPSPSPPQSASSLPLSSSLSPPPSSKHHHHHPKGSRKFSLTSSLALGASLFALDARLDPAAGPAKAQGPVKGPVKGPLGPVKGRGVASARRLKVSTISGARGIRNLMNKTLNLRGSHGDLFEVVGSSVSDQQQQQQKSSETNSVIDGWEEVVRVYRWDNASCLVSLPPDSPCALLTALALRELSLSPPLSLSSPASPSPAGFSLYEVSVDATGTTLRQRLLAPHSRGVAESLPPHARLYIKSTLSEDSLCTEEILSSLSSSASPPLSLLSLSPLALAAALSLRSLSFLASVPPTAFVSHILLGEPATDTLQAFEKLLNAEMAWVSWEVLRAETPSRRAKVVTFLIDTATACRRAHNYNSTFAIISGLTHSSVSRLSATWRHVRSASVRELAQLQAVFEPTRNMAAYRQEAGAATPPIVPLYALTKKDLTFIHLGNPTWEGPLLNVDKLRMFARELRRLAAILTAPGDNAGMVIQHRVFSQQNQGTDIVPVFSSARRASAPVLSLAGAPSVSAAAASCPCLPVSVRRRHDECVSARRVRHYLLLHFPEGAATSEASLTATSLSAELPATAATNTDLSGSKDSVSSLPTSSPQSESKMK